MKEILSISDIEDIFRLPDKIEDEELKAQYKKVIKGLPRGHKSSIALKKWRMSDSVIKPAI